MSDSFRPVVSGTALPRLGDVPTASQPRDEVWGSDYIAAIVRSLDVPYIAIVPGSSYRGLHDSIVNLLGNAGPEIVLAISEESAVAIAHGFAKAGGGMMAAAVHANVGLMRASMAAFNAWCDRVPLLLFGATGPMDAAKRRPWIDWIHTAADQGALVRDFTKWDCQPGSTMAAGEAVLRAVQIARTAPRGPVYINLDVSIQETRIGLMPTLPDPRRFAPPPATIPARDQIAEAAALLSTARRPVILAGRGSRHLDAWRARITLAEILDAPVVTSLALAAAFPTDHPLHLAPPGWYLPSESCTVLEQADVILSLDWHDLAGTLKQVYRAAPVTAKVIHVSCDAYSHRGWSADHQALPPVDVYLLCESDVAVPLLSEAVAPRVRVERPARVAPRTPDDRLTIQTLAIEMDAALRDGPVCYTRVPLGWDGVGLHWRHPLDYIDHDGGAGVGSGPGIAVGAGLALRGTGRLPVALLGDGDFLMGNTAVWTAAHYRIPALMVVCNNAGFRNDEQHQGHVAAMRDRPVENRWIGQRLAAPEIDIAGLARAVGAIGIGPITSRAALRSAVVAGGAAAREGRVVVIDVRVESHADAERS